MEWVKLGDHISQIRGVSYSKSDIKHSPCDGYVGLLRADAIQDGNIIDTNLIYVKEAKVSENQYLRDGDILIAASSGSKKLVGKAAQFTKTNKDLTFGAFCKVVRAEDLNKDFLKFFFKSSYYKNTISNLSAGANINNIRNSDIDNLEIILYEEKFEADLVRRLNNIEKLISTRRTQIAALDELVQSVFYEMFENKNFELVKLGEKVKVNPPKNEVKNLDKDLEVTFLPMENVSENGEVDLSETRKLSEVYSGFTYAKNGDVVIAKITPSFENGKGAYLNNLCNDIAFGTTEFHVLRPKKINEINYIWLYYLTMTKKFRMYGELNMSGSAGQKRISKAFIENFQIPLPPLKLQEQFAAKVEAIEAQKAKLQTSLEEIETLFDALMQEAFSGNLG